MSLTTAVVAVAVRAKKVALGKVYRSDLIAKYSGLKSYPHCDIQCASSMAIRSTGSSNNKSLNAEVCIRSGETYKILIVPCKRASCASFISSLSNPA